ncbi:hypothetical protein [Kibdelosporangium phytohabitans]|uniref:Uncharacterized protein n=1 Tax=Kibdelosporangium phytohabitans TaxID=860235 RepID=A0A0N7F2P5_9PSEU|nr:hypothetical protein [Kibdelosporangium phytohabitans]ALG06407.1 hypothetical protein AOZ06_05235 [Kibdelosporangium phytohabitans]MBE1467559.1 hypothetical protein [Kibdelosporangium phytohabitans]
MPSLFVLCEAYGRGPSGQDNETITPTDLIAEAYERLTPEDQLTIKQLAAARPPQPDTNILRMPRGVAQPDPYDPLGTRQLPARRSDQVGTDFTLTVPTIEYGNPDITLFTLPNARPGLLDLTWETFGYGVDRLSQQIKSLGRRLDVDICFGVNEAGLVMATFLASARFSRCPIGYLRCNKIRDGIELDVASLYPDAKEAPTIVVCDFEVKHADNIGYLTHELRARYPKAELYFAVFGAMTKSRNLDVTRFDDLTGAKIMRAASFEAVFVAATMGPPGIEPPLELR